MAVVRCPKHNVPYSEENPRGCPACWQETIGNDPANLMKELARASKGILRVEILPPPTEEEVPTQRLSGIWPAPVTTPPRLPTPEPSGLQRLGVFVRSNLAPITLVTAGATVAVLLWIISRPTFVPTLVPPPVTGEALPFPVSPNAPILAAFAMLGPQSPQVHPDSRALARYDFQQGTFVDVYNGVVYAVTLTNPSRSWQGNRVGLAESRVRGRLALLGAIREDAPLSLAPMLFAGYLTYGNLASLPRRRLTAEVRPPNGCYDVQVDVAPQVIGTASTGADTLVAVARSGGSMTWVVHQVRIVSRAMPGPYAGPPVCS